MGGDRDAYFITSGDYILHSTHSFTQMDRQQIFWQERNSEERIAK